MFQAVARCATSVHIYRHQTQTSGKVAARNIQTLWSCVSMFKKNKSKFLLRDTAIDRSVRLRTSVLCLKCRIAESCPSNLSAQSLLFLPSWLVYLSVSRLILHTGPTLASQDKHIWCVFLNLACDQCMCYTSCDFCFWPAGCQKRWRTPAAWVMCREEELVCAVRGRMEGSRERLCRLNRCTSPAEAARARSGRSQGRAPVDWSQVWDSFEQNCINWSGDVA